MWRKKKFKPDFFDRIFGYDPKITALRETLSIVSHKGFTQELLAKIFVVSQPTVSRFLSGSNSKKLLDSFYKKINQRNTNVSILTEDTEAESNITMGESALLLKKKNQ